MPEGLTKMEQMKWKRENKAGGAGGAPAPPAPSSPAPPGPPPAGSAAGDVDLGDMPEGLTKMEQMKWKRDQKAKAGS